jgi:uncharacterized protein (TIGR02266 family)
MTTATLEHRRTGLRRHPRVNLPVLVSFATATYTVEDYVLNLSEGGIFLLTERSCLVGTRGRLTFRLSQFDNPFELQAEVVRNVDAGDETDGQKRGMGMMFVDPTERTRQQLRQLVAGVQSGSVVAAIRRAIGDCPQGLEVALRNRPTDQKLILALHARGQEIDVLLRDSNPSVLIRLLDCPRLASQHVQSMLRNRGLPTRVLSAICKERKWLTGEEHRWLFCTHPAAMLNEVLDEMRRLSAAKLAQLERNAGVRPQVRMKAQELKKQRQRRGLGG